MSILAVEELLHGLGVGFRVDQVAKSAGYVVVFVPGLQRVNLILQVGKDPDALSGRKIYGERTSSVVAGHGDPMRGIDQAIRHMRRGAKARLILPSEQAYGVVGDGGAIGHREILVVEMEVISEK